MRTEILKWILSPWPDHTRNLKYSAADCTRLVLFLKEKSFWYDEMLPVIITILLWNEDSSEVIANQTGIEMLFATIDSHVGWKMFVQENEQRKMFSLKELAVIAQRNNSFPNDIVVSMVAEIA